MRLTDPAALHAVNTAPVIAPTAADIEALTAFYDASYPGHWFDARMLESGQYRGIREGGRWLAAAGVHAELGGVSRRRARQHRHCPRAQTAGARPQVTAAVCQSLLASVDVIGLNVLADNGAARRCYEGLGFTDVCEYHEVLLERR